MRLSDFLLPSTVAASTIPSLSLSCAPNGTIMTTPSYGIKCAIFTVCAQSTIHAPLSSVFHVVLDFPRYSEWNTFVYAVGVPDNVSSYRDVYLGMPMALHTYGLIPVLNSTSQDQISYLEPDAQPPSVGWPTDAGLGLAGLQAEHISLYRDLGNGMTEYSSWETYYVVVVVVVLALKDRLQKVFEDQGRDLKARAEGLLL